MTQQTFAHGYALLVGVGADLPVTIADATALRDVLVDPNRAAYPPAQVTLLTETAATRSQILAAFDETIAQANANPEATVVIYYSGHGGCIEGTDDYFLVPYGFDWDQRATTAISSREFTEKIEAIKARKLVVLLDCCHAAGMPVTKELGETFVKSPVPPDLLQMLGTGSGRVVVASSRADERSYYVGTPYSAFTDCLLEALQGKAAVNQDGYARILDVLIYLFAQVPDRAMRMGPQHPYVNKVLDLGDNFPLCYYAGGDKGVPGALSSSSLRLAEPSAALTPWQQRQLTGRREALLPEWDLRSLKVKRMRSDLAIEAGTAVKFQLEQQLLAEEAKLAQLAAELTELEQKLSGLA